jgi:hypothetical protein
MTPIESKALALISVRRRVAASEAEQKQRDEVRQSMLTDVEAASLVQAFRRTRGDRECSAQEVTDLLNEVISIRFISACTNLAANDLIDIDLDPSLPPSDRLVFTWRKDIDEALARVVQERTKSEK